MELFKKSLLLFLSFLLLNQQVVLANSQLRHVYLEERINVVNDRVTELGQDIWLRMADDAIKLVGQEKKQYENKIETQEKYHFVVDDKKEEVLGIIVLSKLEADLNGDFNASLGVQLTTGDFSHTFSKAGQELNFSEPEEINFALTQLIDKVVKNGVKASGRYFEKSIHLDKKLKETLWTTFYFSMVIFFASIPLLFAVLNSTKYSQRYPFLKYILLGVAVISLIVWFTSIRMHNALKDDISDFLRRFEEAQDDLEILLVEIEGKELQ